MKAQAVRRAAWWPSAKALRAATHQTIQYSQAIAADPGDGCQLQDMRPLYVIECEEAVMDQGPGRRGSQSVTFP